MLLPFIKNNRRVFLLAILLIALCFFYKIPQHIQDRPYGQHIWRQCDGASFAWTYTHVSMNFFEPRHINVFNADGKMCPEFPIVYYTAACLNKVFGYHEAYIRIIHLALFFIGLFALSAIAYQLTKHTIISIILPLLFFTSPMFVFYGPNFLPDVAAISMGFVGVYFFMRYKITNSLKHAIYTIIAFAVCGLLKPTAMNLFFAIGVLWVLEQVFNISITTRKVFSRSDFWIFFSVLSIVFAWYVFAIKYNYDNKSIYMQAFVKPIWKSSEVPIAESLVLIWQKHIKVLFDYPLLYFAIYSLIFSLFSMKKEFRWISLFNISMILILAINIIFFYHQFYHHEYYLMVFFPLLISSILFAFIRLNQSNFKYKRQIQLVSLIFLLMVLNMNMHQSNRYLDKLKNHCPDDDYFQSYYGIDKLILQNGIDPNARIWCWADNSTSISLYLIGHRGWTQFYHADGSLEACKKYNIQYLLINTATDKDQGEILYLKNKLVFAEKGFELYKIY